MYVYKADVWCDDCAEEIRESFAPADLADFDPADENTYDSDDYPKGPYDDDESSSDTPQHCAAGSDCLNAITLPSGRKVGHLFGSLTSNGIQYVLESHRTSPSEVTALWLDHFDLEP